MYSIVQGIVHPRIGVDLQNKNLNFYDISESQTCIHLMNNLMKDILDNTKSKNIRHVFEDFFKVRALDLEGSNYMLNNISVFFNDYEELYRTKTGFNFYLVKREENKILNVFSVWKCKRENPKGHRRKSKKRVNKILF